MMLQPFDTKRFLRDYNHVLQQAAELKTDVPFDCGEWDWWARDRYAALFANFESLTHQLAGGDVAKLDIPPQRRDSIRRVAQSLCNGRMLCPPDQVERFTIVGCGLSGLATSLDAWRRAFEWADGPVTPEGLTGSQLDIWNVVMSAGRRMKTPEILEKLEAQGTPVGDSAIKQHLATFTQRLKVWDNRRGYGYGLPDWPAES